MTWVDSHKLSEELAIAAHEALRAGETIRASGLFLQSASAEESALSFVDAHAKPRTFGITAVSTAALWYKGGNLDRAEIVAYQTLSHTSLETFASSQLRALLQNIWNARAQQAAGVRFVPGQVQIAVRGGEVVAGGAPLELVVEKVQTIQAIFYRTAEWLKNMPLRRSGRPNKDIRDICRPWLFQSVPSSYQFVVAVQSPRQSDWVSPSQLDPQIVTSAFLSILRTVAEDPVEGLSALVPQKEYKAAFLSLARNLTPSGKDFDQLEIRAAGDIAPIVLIRDSRKMFADALKAGSDTSNDKKMISQTLRGVLRAVHLDQDWIELMVEGNRVHIQSVGEALDDVIGPMINHSVLVNVLKDEKGKLHFKDMDRDDSA